MSNDFRYPARCIHGDKRQEERDWVLGEFKGGRSPILVATDVAARGLGEFQSLYVVCIEMCPCEGRKCHLFYVHLCSCCFSDTCGR